MPRKQSCAVELHEKLVSAMLASDASVSEMCRGYGPAARRDAKGAAREETADRQLRASGAGAWI